MAGQHSGAVGFGLRGYRAGGVAGEAALRDHLRQEGLVLAHHTGNTHGIVCERDTLLFPCTGKWETETKSVAYSLRRPHQCGSECLAKAGVKADCPAPRRCPYPCWTATLWPD